MLNPMPGDLSAILRLEVPVIVLLARRAIALSEVTSWVPGAILELPKDAEEELELLINNKVIGTGRAVKVGENFGIRLAFVGAPEARVHAMGGREAPAPAPAAAGADTAGQLDADALAEQMLAGQLGQAA